MAASASIHASAELKLDSLSDPHRFSDTALTPGLMLPVTGEENKENKIENLTNNISDSDRKDHQNLDENGGQGAEAADSPVIDIVVSNVVCTFNLRCHINLRRLALEGSNVEYRRENGVS